MNLSDNKADFSTLLSYDEAKALLQDLDSLDNHLEKESAWSVNTERKENIRLWKNEWQKLSTIRSDDGIKQTFEDSEQAATSWLIQLFNTLFSDQQVVLVRSTGEPEYFPASNNEPARIEFAHGFFASALHEIHTPLYRLTCYKPLILIMYITTLLLS